MLSILAEHPDTGGAQEMFVESIPEVENIVPLEKSKKLEASLPDTCILFSRLIPVSFAALDVSALVPQGFCDDPSHA